MPPQSTLLAGGDMDDELSIIPDRSEGPILEERKLELNFKEIIRGIKTLDYSKVVWRNVALFFLLHLYCVYGAYLALTSCAWKTLFYSYALFFIGAQGITMGVHRLWSHRSYKANFIVRFILAVGQTSAFQNSIYEWARDHRVHHKFSETDADPHNATRGLFFSHMGWLMMRKHPDVREKGKKINCDDLLADPIVFYQRKFYLPLVILLCFVVPTVIPWYFWNESFINSLMVPGFLRYTILLHMTWFVNSLAHWIGSKPYDETIYPSQNPFVAIVAMGEGWHNYHHVFPYDYRTAELGGNIKYNVTTLVIDFFSLFGWVYDRKTVSEEMSKQRATRTGDGSHGKKEY